MFSGKGSQNCSASEPDNAASLDGVSACLIVASVTHSYCSLVGYIIIELSARPGGNRTLKTSLAVGFSQCL